MPVGLVEDGLDMTPLQLRERYRCGTLPIGGRGSGSRRLQWQIAGVDHAAVGEQHRALDDVAELADVSGPAIPLKGLHGLLGETRRRCASILVQEVIREE